MKPQAGKPYTIQDENSLSQIAKRAYGDGTLWPRIWRANQTRLKSGNPDLIYPGETIIIPLLPERAKPSASVANRDPEGIYIELDGYEIRPMTCRILRTMDTIVNACKVTIPWEPSLDANLDKRIRPKSYTDCKVSIGGERIISGLLYGVQSFVTDGTTLELSIETPTADIVDSTLKPPMEFSNITLEDMAKKLAESHGFSVQVQTDTGGPFDTVTAENNETIFGFLKRLAKQRGVLLTNDLDNNVLIIKPNTTGAPVATLEENVTTGVSGWGLAVNGREMFNVYRTLATTPLDELEAIATDNKVPRSRFTTVQADDAIEGDIQKAAIWARNKTTADALSFSLTVNDWRQPNGKLWEENQLVTVISPSMWLENGFDFLINRVEYVLGSQGRSTVLNFVVPSAYTQGDIVEPW